MRIILSSLTSSQDFCEDNTYIHICVYLHILYIYICYLLQRCLLSLFSSTFESGLAPSFLELSL